MSQPQPPASIEQQQILDLLDLEPAMVELRRVSIELVETVHELEGCFTSVNDSRDQLQNILLEINDLKRYQEYNGVDHEPSDRVLELRRRFKLLSEGQLRSANQVTLLYDRLELLQERANASTRLLEASSENLFNQTEAAPVVSQS